MNVLFRIPKKSYLLFYLKNSTIYSLFSTKNLISQNVFLKPITIMYIQKWYPIPDQSQSDPITPNNTCTHIIFGPLKWTIPIRWLGLISFGPLQPAKKSDWLWLGLISFGLLQPAKKSDWEWLHLISFGLLQPAKKCDWVWLGLIGFGPLQPAKKSDQVWLDLIGFGPLQPAKWLGMVGFDWLWSVTTCKVIRYGWVWLALVHYNLQRKLIGYGWD